MKSKLAITGFVLSLLPIVWPSWYFIRNGGDFFNNFIGVLLLTSTITFPLGILAVILGITALVRIRRNNLEGKGFAIAGIIIGSVPAIIGLIFIILNLIY